LLFITHAKALIWNKITLEEEVTTIHVCTLRKKYML